MDVKKLAFLVSQCPPLWDRSNEKFRDQAFKAAIWKKVGNELNTTDVVCKEAYKALREKYIREREKLQQFGNYCKPWEMLDHLQFLDPYITTRKSGGTNIQQFEEYVAIKQDPVTDTESNFQDDAENLASNFCKALIKMVHQSRALWDRNYKDYNDKQIKDHLWVAIANTLKSDVTSCSLKWKSLREKYIRQKQKYSEGECKWEFLDDLSFLDGVILYRKKPWRHDEINNSFTNSDNCFLSQSNCEYELMDDGTNDSMPNQLPTSNVKHAAPSLLTHAPDSTLEIVAKNERKRTLSNASETSYHQNKKSSKSQNRTPDQIFGELVTAMLSVKSEDEKKLAMMEIMSILTRPNP